MPANSKTKAVTHGTTIPIPSCEPGDNPLSTRNPVLGCTGTLSNLLWTPQTWTVVSKNVFYGVYKELLAPGKMNGDQEITHFMKKRAVGRLNKFRSALARESQPRKMQTSTITNSQRLSK